MTQQLSPSSSPPQHNSSKHGEGDCPTSPLCCTGSRSHIIASCLLFTMVYPKRCVG